MSAVIETTEVAAHVPQNRSRIRSALRSPAGMLGAGVVIAISALGLLAPVLAAADPEAQQAGASLLGPSGDHVLGTDEIGRDIFARLLYGIRQNVIVVVLAVPLSKAIGMIIGLLSTMHPRIDTAVQRLLDVLIAFPNLILGACLAAFLGAGFETVVIVIVLIGIPMAARLTRTAVLTQREREYVLGARAVGASRLGVLFRHVLPNSLDALIVNFVLSAATAIFVEGGLSLLGFGIQPPNPSLGSMVDAGLPYMADQPFYALAPVAVITALVIGLNLFADALNRALRRG
ncbi:ABC transporter permease [Jiangella aurantiaca]|uniref:ABC transporter permease n=1 Tax=Jiangella aurantiaca TaxID=2530373 RepID=A0A4R5A638_9ACTN|nr:ABC transporter permease [Jiangella aurantiaca]TDD67518.1 ABC transporter permease [Jiangella aurantiaca]